MSFLKLKSEENILSADFLISDSKFASSVHCSYYSCVQLMKYILMTDLGKTETEIGLESSGRSFHTWLINKIKRELKSRKVADKTCKKFNSKILALKMSRVQSDYRNEEIIKKIRRTHTKKPWI